MKLTKLHLIIILALTLILCPILGVCHNVREGFVKSIDPESENKREMNMNKSKEDDEEDVQQVDIREGNQTDMRRG
jgi:hypothetical protein